MKPLYFLSFVFLFFVLLAFQLQTSAQAVVDPPTLYAYKTTGTVTLDGRLLEADWTAANYKPHLMFKMDGVPSGNSNTPTGGVVVKPPYSDVSTCYVKFLRDDTNLYISLNSDDQQVCRFGDSWEGDGLFMKIKDSGGTDVEIKLYYNLAGYDPDIHYEGPAYGSGAGYKNPGTIVNDSTNIDAGYSAELMIDLTGLGYTSATTSVPIMINIFDPDNYSDGVPAFGPNGNYYKQWWGSEWGPDMRTLELSDTFVPVELTSFTAQYVGNTTKLNWTTATELNNLGFDVQRSTNGNEFVTIGFVLGKGTTTEVQNYSYVDKTTTPNINYAYRLKQIDFNGNYSYSEVVNLGESNPFNFELLQNYPNPFNPATTISIGLPVKSDITLDVYNIVGERVLSLYNGELAAGNYNYTVDASNLTSGIYIYVLNAVGEDGKNSTQSRKMTLLK
jgi:Secretion system C-terminal sorting domain